mgnify:FL=1
MVSVRIGVSHNPHVLEIAVDSDVDSVLKTLEDSKENADGFVWFTQTNGSTTGIPVEKIAYIEVIQETGTKAGF